MFAHLWRLAASRAMIGPAIAGVCSGVAIVLLILVLRAPGDVVVIEVSPAPDPNIIHVGVSGEVLRPGIYEIPRGSVMGDAVAAAGGFTPLADEGALSAAAEIQDGDLLQVPATARIDGPEDGPALVSTAPVNINTAGIEALDALPGIGPALAQRIIDYRMESGPFQSVDELAEVRGISERMVDELRPLVSVSG